MAFESRVYALRIEPHPNADRLELAAIGGYRCVVGKDSYVDGDLAAYIPEGAVCPDWLIVELGLEGKLAGSKKNRVKAVQLRGSLSQGLVYPVRDGMIRGRQVGEGDDVTELLELVKYEPPIPISMQGEVRAVHGATLKYDIEDFKKYPEEFGEGEPVVMTEKLHGTWCCLGRHAEHGPIVTSKGMSDKGLALLLDDANRNNLYVRTWGAHQEAFESARTRIAADGQSFYVLGEVYGRGVQDLHYGQPNPAFAVFDAYVGEPGTGRYLNPDELGGVPERSVSAGARALPGTVQPCEAAGVDRRRHHAGRRPRARGRGREAGRRARVARVRAGDPEERLGEVPDAQGRNGVQLIRA